MASIGEIANEAKALLEDIEANTLETRRNTETLVDHVDTLNDKVDTLTATTLAGFTNLAQGLAVLIQLQAQNNALLAENNRQNDAALCWLETLSGLLCNIQRNTAASVDIQEHIGAVVSHLDDLLEQVHPGPALDVQNRYKLEKQIAECCPEPSVDPKPCYEPCRKPRTQDYQPPHIDWRPLDVKGSGAQQSGKSVPKKKKSSSGKR